MTGPGRRCTASRRPSPSPAAAAMILTKMTTNYGERFPVAFFNQSCWSAVIQGPKKYLPMTGELFIANAMDTYAFFCAEEG